MRHRQSCAANHPRRISSSSTTPGAGAIAATSSRYCRDADLPKLVGLWPNEIADRSYVGRLRVLAKLRRALRSERQRGLGGHWSYDLARHHQLLAAYRVEAAALVTAARTDETLPEALDFAEHNSTVCP